MEPVNISSYNITDVGYHYIGIRVLASLPDESSREMQFSAVSRSVLKYVSDRALRLMLPAPRGDFQAVGEKVCQELVHLGLAEAPYGKGYALTDLGRAMLQLLNEGDHLSLRRKMVGLQLKTYDNLREVFLRHLDAGSIWSPVVDASRFTQQNYIELLLKPTFGTEAESVAEGILNREAWTPRKTEDLLREAILRHLFPHVRITVPLFRSMCDRLVSLRLLNIMRATIGDCEFAKSYSPCRLSAASDDWHAKLSIPLDDSRLLDVYLSEPDMKDQHMRQALLSGINEALPRLAAQAGYYDLPQVRDLVCERLMIPEATFDEGVNELLDIQPSPPVTVGLAYEGISARRKPLVRNRQTIQIFNLIRRV
jgi:hypothetical protein